MKTKLALIVTMQAAFVCVAMPSYAQSETRYQVGLRTAQERRAPDTRCYATVYSRHAVVVENANGTRRWFAASTPAYNADMRRTCGIDRLALIQQQQVRRSPATSASGHSNGGAYRAGLRLAERNGYANKDCVAQVFTRYAYPLQRQGSSGEWYGYNTGAAFTGELRSKCGV